MARFSTSRAWEESRQIFVRDGGLLSAVALALLVLPNIIAGVVSPSTESASTLGGRTLDLIAAFIGVIGQLALIRLALGPSTSVGDAIRHGFRRFPSTFGALVIIGLGVFAIVIPVILVLMSVGAIDMTTGQTTAGGSLPVLGIVVVFLLIGARLMMSVPVASAEEIGPVAILKRTWQLTKGSYWVLLGLELLLLILAVVMMLAATVVGGTVANLVGGDLQPYSLSSLILSTVVALAQAVFTVLASVMLARMYAQLVASDVEVSVPTTGI